MSSHPLYNSTGLQINNKSHVMYALTSKQMELNQLQEEYRAKILKVQADMEALKRTICLFDEDCKEIFEKVSKNTNKNRAKSERNSYFIRGECKKMVLDYFRKSSKVLSTSDISLSIQAIKGYSLDEPSFNQNFQKTIVSMLRHLEKNRLIEQSGRDGLTILWKIKEFN